MLKVQINKNEFKSDLIEIAYSDIDAEVMEIEYEDGEDTVTYSPNKEALVVTCYHDDGIEVKGGDKIVGSYNAEDSDGFKVTNTQNFVVNGSDVEEHSFSFFADKFTSLGATSFAYGKTEDYIGIDEETGKDAYNNGAYIFLYLDRFHFLTEDNYPDGATVFFLNEDGSDFELACEVFGDKAVRLPLDQLEPIVCEDSNDEFCMARAAEVEKYNQMVIQNRIVAMILFKYYGIIENYDDDWDSIYERLFEDNVMSEEYSATPFIFREYNPLFVGLSDPDRLQIFLVRPKVSLSIPLVSKFS